MAAERTTIGQRLATSAAAITGGGLALATRAASRLRTSDRPLHPRGVLLTGHVRRFGGAESAGVPWLDEPGDDAVVVRLSRAAGLPTRLPDVSGLAIRIPYGGGHADVLLSSTGWGPVSRFVLRPTRTTSGVPMTTLLPYRGSRGPLLLGAYPRANGGFGLTWAWGRGRWHDFAVLEISEERHATPVSFDHVLNTPVGLTQYAVVRRLRAPSYRAARRSRGERD